MPFWVTTESGKQGTVGVPSHVHHADMKPWIRGFIEGHMPGEIAQVIDSIPYPANPVWNNPSECPAFCYQPSKCKGRGSCPSNPACSE